MTLEPDDLSFEDDDDWGPDGELSAGSESMLAPGRTGEYYLLRRVARLVIGGAAEGGDILVDRLETWDTRVERLGRAVYHEAPDESEGERLRYALLGLAVVGTNVVQGAVSRTASASEAAFGLVSAVLSPVTGSRLMRPVARGYDSLAARGEATVERLIDMGRAAEQRSRAVAREAYDDGSTEVIQVAADKLAAEPALRDLVTQQGMSMAGEIVVALRSAAAGADVPAERPIHTLLRRSPAAQPAMVPTATTAPTAHLVIAPAAYGRPAGFVSRLVAFVTDVAVVTLGGVVLGGVITLILNFFGLGAQQLQAGSSGQVLQLIRTLTVFLSGLAVLLFVPLYFIVFWSLTGATPGHLLLGLRVIHGDQPRIAWPRGLLRFIGYFLAALPLFLGFFWVLGDRQRQGWHDKLAKTHVVYAADDVPPRA